MDDIVRRYQRWLPHWRVNTGVYFVTWHLRREQPPLGGEERDLIVRALQFFNGSRYALHAHVVMDDHVHVVTSPYPEFTLEQLVHSWKSYTGHLLRCGRTPPVWQREYFDRIIRNEREFDDKVEYILLNPSRRWPDLTEYRWLWCRPDLRE